MSQHNKLILIANDDGIAAPGLRHLVDCVASLGDVVVVAPEEQHSGQSSALTVNAPLRLRPAGEYGGATLYAVNGTPVDCVKLAMHLNLGGRRPDLMLAGVNHGSNAGNSVVYSGTMGAVMEASMAGIPAVGYSLLHHSIAADFTYTTPFIVDVTTRVLAGGLPEGVCLNINFPAKTAIEGMKVVRAARGFWTEEYQEYTDPHGKPFYWLTGRFHNLEPEAADTDEYWLARRYASCVPVLTDLTCRDALAPVAHLLGLCL